MNIDVNGSDVEVKCIEVKKVGKERRSIHNIWMIHKGLAVCFITEVFTALWHRNTFRLEDECIVLYHVRAWVRKAPGSQFLIERRILMQ